MHVAFVVPNYPPHAGGVERHVELLGHELLRRGVDVTVMNVESRGSRVHNGITVVGLGRHLEIGGVLAFPDLDVSHRIGATLRSAGATHVSVHTRFFPATWLGIHVAHRLGLPVSITEHGGGPVASSGRLIRRASGFVDSTAGRWALMRADAALAVSARSAQFVRATAGRDATVCGNGIDGAWWAPVGPVASDARLVFVGRLVREKGWRTFLDIVESLETRVRGVIAGGGPDEFALRTEVRRRGLASRIEILGQVPPERLRPVLRGAVYVNPSTAAEGLQTTLLEAACAGARIATFDVGGAAEVLESGAVAEVVAVGDDAALLQAVERSLRSEWRATRVGDQFSWTAIADTYVSVWEQL